jgi:NhaP-type Na+/H+ or K+/H+ antiporter
MSMNIARWTAGILWGALLVAAGPASVQGAVSAADVPPKAP